MRMANAVRFGGWLLVAVNLFMAVGAIQVIIRMTPAIERIIERNERSIRHGVEMLSALALSGGGAMSEQLRAEFEDALQRAKNNVTEPEEDDVLALIDRLSAATFRGETEARQEMVSAILRFGTINREAIFRADHAARQLGYAGAWGGVFMATSIFLAGFIFIRGVTRRVVRPLEEIHAVIAAQRRGEVMRRCSGEDLSQEARIIFSGINEILDQRHFQSEHTAVPRQ
jgi:uncharacterized membrane protein